MTKAVDQILEFWLGEDAAHQPSGLAGWPPAAVSKRWFKSTKKDDAFITESFGESVQAAITGDLGDWETTARSRLALILLLDQFPRNIFRHTAYAFAGDSRAVELAQTGVEEAMEQTLPWAGQMFFYMPLMHAESLKAQQLCERCFIDMRERMPVSLKKKVDTSLHFARDHLAIIEQFGRFPHRNEVLGRNSTDAEKQFLKTANRYGQ